MRLYDRINSECARIIDPDVIVMTPEGAGKLLEELSEEFETDVDMDNIFKFIGMDVVISLQLNADYRLARFLDIEF